MPASCFIVTIALTATDLAGTPHEGDRASAVAAVHEEVGAIPGALAVSVIFLLPEPEQHCQVARLELLEAGDDGESLGNFEAAVGAAVRLALWSPMRVSEHPHSGS